MVQIESVDSEKPFFGKQRAMGDVFRDIWFWLRLQKETELSTEPIMTAYVQKGLQYWAKCYGLLTLSHILPQ